MPVNAKGEVLHLKQIKWGTKLSRKDLSERKKASTEHISQGFSQNGPTWVRSGGAKLEEEERKGGRERVF